MDDSLDNYISKANFKVKVGNPRFKGNPGQNPAAGGFQGKRKFGGHQLNQVTNVSITVPAVRKTAVNKNSTNQIRDARDRLVSKAKPVDARNKLNQKARNTDARQKLMAIRAKKEPVDARAKLQAKKQSQSTGAANAQPGSFTLTRTVSNNSGGGGNIQVTPGTQGNVSITKTLTKVMPPGYDAVLGASTKTSKPQNATKPSNVMKRLGTPAGQQSNIPNITRTISNPHKPVSKPQHMVQDHRAPVPQTHSLPYPPAPTNVPPPYQHPQTNYSQPPPVNVPPYPVQHPPQHPVPASPQYPPPVQTTLPYPPQDPLANREFQHQVIPKIEVQNDQYRPPEPQYPQYAAPPTPQYAPPPQQYTYTQPQQHPYYQPPSDDIYAPPPARQEVYQASQDSYRSSQSSSSGTSFVKTIVNDVKPERQFSPESSPLKRKSFGASSSYESSSASSSGPLRSSTINYIPVIESTGNVSSSKAAQKPKLTKVMAPGEPAVKRLKQEDEENVISPLQGYKVSITNLATTVTQDDIIELFGAVGAVKSVKVVKNGTAEVVYVKKDAAQEATKTYHDRELDGLPMIVKMVTPISARIKEAPEKLPPTMKPAATGPLELSKKSIVKPRSSQKDVDVTTLHKALFKTGTSGSTKPVTFTVNI
ncbi:polymerase delta-interacting protein 3 [Mactra antiquata]